MRSVAGGWRDEECSREMDERVNSYLWLIQASGAILLSSRRLCRRDTRFRLVVWLKTASEISSITLFSRYSS